MSRFFSKKGKGKSDVVSSLPVTLVNVFFAVVPFVSFDAVTRVLGHQVIASGPVLTRVTRTLVDVNLTIVSFIPVGTTTNVGGRSGH